ncbi:28S rRNA (cytosine-C(5))-methyltransferase-like [Physella acuta]|uniref:28S rRNA (cytosine-C(5))-methyltransferase-like n=1 Tax=Physella acuta TaxID=109671 RepID=UPI0027DD01E6|nr:28S rRNA (cytosine-C(5))-methyltransferase-like [Physella acuta]
MFSHGLLKMENDIFSEAASVLEKANVPKNKLKKIVTSTESQNTRQLLALVSQITDSRKILEEILSHCPASNGFMEETIVGGSSEKALVLLYELLLGRNFGKNFHLRKIMQNYKAQFQNATSIVLRKYNAKSLRHLVTAVAENKIIKIPCYMRVNIIKSTVEDAIHALKVDGWKYTGKISSYCYQKSALSLGKDQFGLDPYLSDLLIFPVGTDLHNHRLTISGVLVQQDRAGCFPCHVLNPTSGSYVIECCAAPGNKSVHLASLLKNTGKVLTMNQPQKNTLKMSKLLENHGVTCVESVYKNFLSVDPTTDGSNIDLILLDPSCSGSGLFGKESEKDISRIEKLQKNQILLLKHALRFPNVKRVVYSTCSTYEEENEAVVEQVMEKVSKFFRFTKIFPHWKGSRGVDKYPNANNFLRTLTESDLTQSFFVACFERVNEVTDKANKECDVTASGEMEPLKEENRKKRKKRKHSESEPGVETENNTLNVDLIDHIQRNNVKSETDQEEALTNSETFTENMDNEVLNVLSAPETNGACEKTKKKKKSKKRKHAETDDLELENLNVSEEKKNILPPLCIDSTEPYRKKKKKKRRHSSTDSEFKNEDLSLDVTEQAKEKKKTAKQESSEIFLDAVQKHLDRENEEEERAEAKEKSKKKKKKKRHSENE